MFLVMHCFFDCWSVIDHMIGLWLLGQLGTTHMAWPTESRLWIKSVRLQNTVIAFSASSLFIPWVEVSFWCLSCYLCSDLVVTQAYICVFRDWFRVRHICVEASRRGVPRDMSDSDLRLPDSRRWCHHLSLQQRPSHERTHRTCRLCLAGR